MGPYSFSSRFRIRTASEFRAVFNRSKRLSNKHLRLRWCRNDLAHSRLGIIITKRAIKTAVGRNRVKRCIREHFRQNQSLLAPVDIVVLVNFGCNDLKNKEIFECLERLWQKLIKDCSA